jgi:holdfast attachment protein HfaB
MKPHSFFTRMKSIHPRLQLKLLTGALCVLVLPACTTLPSFSSPNYVDPMDSAEVVENQTRYSGALQCMAPKVAQSNPPRFAVGKVSDFTGKEDLVNGKRLTQGAALMVMSALGKAGVPLVERFDTSIADIELKYSDNKLITDSPDTREHRRIFSGALPGSDYHVVGGITEVNYNIKSGSLESTLRFIGASARYFVMDVGVDLRLVNTKTLEVVNIQSLQKQIIGTELRGGYFRLFSDGLVDINSSERTQEPIQRGVRMVLEQAVFNMVNQTLALNAQDCLLRTKLNQTQAQRANPTQSKALSPVTNRAVATTTSVEPASSTQATPVDSIVLTPPPPKPGIAASPTEDKVIVDPNTGEALYASEIESSNSLFGAPISPGEETSTKREMQEKLLWGNRPMIR